MSVKTFFVINEQSQLERWDLSRKKLNADEVLANALTKTMVRKVTAAFPMSLIDKDVPMMVDLAIGNGGYVVARMPLNKIRLEAPFAVEAAMVYPHFDGKHPFQVLDWKVPNTMRLFLCAHIHPTFEVQETFLVALDNDRRAWRLPLSNLYGDCRLCTGRYHNIGDSILKGCQLCYNQFITSKWNDHLYTDATEVRRSATKSLFAFDVNNETFTQRPAPKNWPTLCEKVGTEFITSYVCY